MLQGVVDFDFAPSWMLKFAGKGRGGWGGGWGVDAEGPGSIGRGELAFLLTGLPKALKHTPHPFSS